MTDYFNLTNATSSNNFVDFTVATSDILLEGKLGLIILLIVFSVFFLAVKSRGFYTSASFSVACWITTLTALLLRPMGLINDGMWWTALMLTPIAILTLIIVGAGE